MPSAHFSGYTTRSSSDVLKEFNVTTERGLSNQEIQQRQTQYGMNEIANTSVRWWTILLRQCKSPFIYLLLGAALLASVLGEYVDGSMITVFVAINVTIGFLQEFRSEHTIRLLKQFVVRKVHVRRHGEDMEVENKELVPGDIVLLEPGDIIPADIRFLDNIHLTVDESVLTGESIPITKIGQVLSKPTNQVFEARNIGFSGTTIISGKAEGVVIATGRTTSLGEITNLTSHTPPLGDFQKGLNQFSKFILALTSITLVVMVVVNVLIKDEPNLTDLIIFSIALAVSVIPEGLPVVSVFSLSRGALHLAKKKVVVKQLSSIEELGSIEILCTDKTGTITENKLTVAGIYGDAQQVVRFAALGAPSLHAPHSNEAYDRAILERLGHPAKQELEQATFVKEIPFDPERRRNSMVVTFKNNHYLIVRGATEQIINLSKSVPQREGLHQWVAEEGGKGRRTLAVAYKPLSSLDNDPEQEENGLIFLGVLSFVDPLKRSSRSAIKGAQKLGVAIKILTGDAPEVAGAIAYEAGLASSPTAVITGQQFEALAADQQKKALQEYAVFARVSPQQKYSIIQLLQHHKQVGFLGEGINDAPALTIAHVGLVVQGASDVAIEASDIVLLNKSLQVIVDGIKEGRAIYANIIKYIKATISSNLGNFYAIALASFVVDFLPMLPLQILLVNLLSDFPMIAIAADNVDTGELRRPRHYNIKDVVFISTVLGLVSTVFDFIFFGMFYRLGPSILQTNWFVASILTELVFLFSIRTQFPFFKARRPSPLLLWLSIAAFLTTIIVPFTSVGQTVFQFVQPQPVHLLMILGTIAIYFVVTESTKLAYYHFFNHSPQPDQA